jgi:putative flippase GtrA
MHKFAKYLLIGLLNSGLCLTIMYLSARMGMDYLSYTALGYLIAIGFSFFLNRFYTFQVKHAVYRQLTLFVIISVANLGLVELIEYTLVESFLFNKLFAVFCGMSWYAITGFFMNHWLVYRPYSEHI